MTGALRVGPQSAGAEPGPACYGKGGTEPTVTDANVVLGYLPPQLLGGEITLDPDSAAKAVQKIADALHLPVMAAAEGIYDIVNENMFGALRLVSVRRGYDPRDFALVALGGAGPLHANALSKLIGSWPAIIPRTPGVLSALGFLHSDIKTEFSQTVIRSLDRLDGRKIRRGFDELEERAKAWLESEHIHQSKQRIEYQVDMRYYRQGYEFPIEVKPHWFDDERGIREITELFKQVHYQNYSFNIEHEIELVNLRAVAIGTVPKVEAQRHRPVKSSRRSQYDGKTRICYRGRSLEASLYDRNELTCGKMIAGPAVITQSDSTTLILPDCYGAVDPYLNILIWPGNHRSRKQSRVLLKDSLVSNNGRRSR
jgi:N-methylhydantoinase A